MQDAEMEESYMSKKKIIFISAVIILSASMWGCKSDTNDKEGGKSSGTEKETDNEVFEPKESESWVTLPDGVLAADNSNEENPITVNLEGADKYTISANSDDYSVNVFNIQNTADKTQFGYEIEANEEIICRPNSFLHDFITVLAYREDNIISAAFIHTYKESTGEIYGELKGCYSFDEVNGEPQMVSEEKLESLRQEVFKDCYYMTRDEMNLVMETTNYETVCNWIKFNGVTVEDYIQQMADNYNGASVFSGDEINPMELSVNNCDNIKVMAANDSFSISADENGDAGEGGEEYTLEYIPDELTSGASCYITDNSEEDSNKNIMIVKLCSGDTMVAHFVLYVYKENGVITVIPNSIITYDKDGGEYPEISNVYFEEMLEHYKEMYDIK